MYFPKLSTLSQQRLSVERFGGLDRRVGSGAGCLREMENLWSGGYPALETRPERGLITTLERPGGFVSKEALVWVDGTKLYINGVEIGLTLTAGEKRMVGMGAYLLIFPDKLYVNTTDFSDCGSMEKRTMTEGEVTFTLCSESGEPLGSYTVGTNAPMEATTGELWLDTSREESVMRRYDGSAWQEVADVCTRIGATGIGTGFQVGDGVTLSGCGAAELNGLQVLRAVSSDWLVVSGLCRTLDSQTATVAVLRTVPDMDFVVEQGNRLWGCKYGIVDGEAVNEVYACKLGDFRNWNCFAGLSTDSYAAARGSDGVFTGAAACQGSVVFFKEHCMERVYPAAGGGHQIVTVACTGVRKGAGDTVAVSDGVVYYLGGDGVYAFDGSMPVCVSQPLGNRHYATGTGGGESGRYWLSVRDNAGTWELLVYDTARKLWHRQDALEVMSFSRHNGYMLALCRDGRLMSMEGDLGNRESALSWSAETGDLGLYTPEHKYLARIELRLELAAGAQVTAQVRCDNNSVWETVGSVTAEESCLGGYVMRLRPRRCGHLRLRLSGQGQCRLYSASAVYEKGSDEP